MFDQTKSWPFQEARSLLAHITAKGKKPGDLVTFETGYGPSGTPHIGTFGEVVRTLWVMRAFRAITDNQYPTRLIMFSDDYDALRKVPDDMPESMKDYLGFRLTAVPSPYDDKLLGSSFGMANNSKLVDFVSDILGVYDHSLQIQHTDGFPKFYSWIKDPEELDMNRPGVFFCSATEFYRKGYFNDDLLNVWHNHQAILDILLPTFGPERAATYCAFMPLSGPDGQLDRYVKGAVQIVPDYEGHVINREKGYPVTSPVTHGMAKLQWYVDWAMRWNHFDVDYEMSGKDLMDSVKLSSQICKVLGGTPPLNLTYELFLDEHGAKISKTKGNGFTIQDWLRIGTMGSLMLFMFQDPRKAKKLYRDIVPQIEDQYLKLRGKEAGPDDPNWHFSVEPIAPMTCEVSYQLLLNLGIVSQSATEKQLMAYLQQNREIPQAEYMFIHGLATKVLQYAIDSGRIGRARRQPTEKEAAAFSELATRFSLMVPNMDAEHFQFQVYEVGKRHEFQPLRTWFQALYECLLGSSDGPRFGAFTAAYGLNNTIALLRQYEQVEA